MEKFDLSSWSDDIENYKKIDNITIQVLSITDRIKCNEFSNILCEDINIVMSNIIKVLSFWTGSTYVGNIKSNIEKTCFQKFFNAFYGLLIVMKNSKEKQFVDFANKCLYQGIVYRYLGNSGSQHKSKKIKPQYNDIYVSWSKNPTNQYIESKLYGIMTIITCNISGSYYGIDLTAFKNISRGEEAEVVFPTIEKTITNIEYKNRQKRYKKIILQ